MVGVSYIIQKLFESTLRNQFCLSTTIFKWIAGLYYASPSSGEAYSDRQLTPNFELRVEIFCVPTCFHNMRIPKPCLSVPWEKKSPWLRQYQSYISNWYIKGKVSTNTTTWKPENLNFCWKLKSTQKNSEAGILIKLQCVIHQ